MSEDSEIYNEMAKILVAFAPKDAVLVKYKLVIECDVDDPEGGVFRTYFDFINQLEEENWFDIESFEHRMRLGDLAFSLRDVMTRNGQEKWTTMTFSVNLIKKSFETNFEYGLSNCG